MTTRPSPPSHRRRRPTRRQYQARRMMVGALLALGALVGYVLVGAALDDGAASTGEEVVPAASDDPAASAGPAPVTPEATDPASTTTTTTGEPEIPSAATPARLYIAGDSDAGTFGPYLQSLMAETGIVEVDLDYKVSSGLARPDFFDWPSHFAASIPAVAPDIVVVTFGGNDAQGLADATGDFVVSQPTGEEGGDVEWRAEYGRRVGAAMDELAGGGRTLIWVGIPNDDDPAQTARMRVQDEVVKAEAAKRPTVVLIDTWKRFSGVNGGWAEYVIDPRDGVGKDVRADDGFHLNEIGAEIIALDIANAVRDALRARGANLP